VRKFRSAARKSLAELAAKNAFYVSEARFEAANFVVETEFARDTKGCVETFFGVAVKDGGVGGRMRVVHGVVGLFGVALAGGQFGFLLLSLLIVHKSPRDSGKTGGRALPRTS